MWPRLFFLLQSSQTTKWLVQCSEVKCHLWFCKILGFSRTIYFVFQFASFTSMSQKIYTYIFILIEDVRLTDVLQTPDTSSQLSQTFWILSKMNKNNIKVKVVLMQKLSSHIIISHYCIINAAAWRGSFWLAYFMHYRLECGFTPGVHFSLTVNLSYIISV